MIRCAILCLALALCTLNNDGIASHQFRKYASDSDRTYKKVERLQKLLYSEANYSPPEIPKVGDLGWVKLVIPTALQMSCGESQKCRRDYIRKDQQAYDMWLIRELPTRYENCFAYSRMKHDAENLEAVLVRLGRNIGRKSPLTKKVRFATMPLRGAGLNAMVKEFGDDSVLFFDDRFYVVAEIFTNIVAEAVGAILEFIEAQPSGTDGGITRIRIRAAIRGRPIIRARFLRAVRGMLSREGLRYNDVEFFIAAKKNAARAIPAQTAMGYFVLAHEYAHILLNHVARKGKAPLLGEVAVRNHEQEMEADEQGLFLTVEVLKTLRGFRDRDLKTLLDVTTGGAILFFWLTNLYDRALAVQQKGESEDSFTGILRKSHPSPGVRWDNLKKVLVQVGQLESIAEETVAGTLYPEIFEALWRDVKSEIANQ